MMPLMTLSLCQHLIQLLLRLLDQHVPLAIAAQLGESQLQNGNRSMTHRQTSRRAIFKEFVWAERGLESIRTEARKRRWQIHVVSSADNHVKLPALVGTINEER
jgi:hypothetical protein